MPGRGQRSQAPGTPRRRSHLALALARRILPQALRGRLLVEVLTGSLMATWAVLTLWLFGQMNQVWERPWGGWAIPHRRQDKPWSLLRTYRYTATSTPSAWRASP